MPLPASHPPPPSLNDLVVGDSMLRPFEHLSWPSHLNVVVQPLSGAGFGKVVERSLAFSYSLVSVIVIHGRVNDASKASGDLAASFAGTCSNALRALSASFAGRKVAISMACMTKSDKVNLSVANVNKQLRLLARGGCFFLLSNNNVRFSNLSDTVHLNAAGTANFFHNVLKGIESAAL